MLSMLFCLAAESFLANRLNAFTVTSQELQLITEPLCSVGGRSPVPLQPTLTPKPLPADIPLAAALPETSGAEGIPFNGLHKQQENRFRVRVRVLTFDSVCVCLAQEWVPST